MAENEVKTGELVARETNALDIVPDFIPKDDDRGVVDIAQEDVKMPRIGLAQQMSPELVEVDIKYIPGLKAGDLFNNVTKQVYGRGPIDFMIVRADPPRYVEFAPLDQGGGIIDINVPPGDPRTQFGPGGEKPSATKFYDYIVMVVPTREFAALSFKSSGLKVAMELNALVKLRGSRPLFAGLYRAVTKSTKNNKGTFFVLDIKNNGWAPDVETYKYAEAAFEGLKKKTIDIQGREPGDDATDFPHGANAPANAGSDAPGSM